MSDVNPDALQRQFRNAQARARRQAVKLRSANDPDWRTFIGRAEGLRAAAYYLREESTYTPSGLDEFHPDTTHNNPKTQPVQEELS